MNRDALVVGINRYPLLKESPTSKDLHLENPARDAEAIASQLEKYGKDEKAWSVRRLPEVNQDGQLKVGIDTVVEENELYGKISELFSPKTYPVPDVALLFFAGHGLRQERDGKTEGFLASSDVSPRKEKWGISLTWLREQLLNSPVKKQIIWLDCCHAGELLNFLTQAELKDWLEGGDRCLIAACRGDREAYGVDEHGVLTRVLLKALDPMEQPEGKWIGSGTVTESIELELETNPILKRQIPLCRNFGERIRFWKGMKQPDNLQKAGKVMLEDKPESPQPAAELDDGLTRWVGRETLISELIAKLQGDCRVLSLEGITGIGKTSLAAKLTRQPEIQAFLPQLKIVDFYQDSPDFQVVARRVLGENLASQPQLLQDEDALVRAMVHKLRSQPYLFVLDMLEAVLQPDGQGGHRFDRPVFGKFLDAVVSAPEMRSRLILTSQDQPPVYAEGRFSQRYYREVLKGLEPLEARMLFTVWDVQTSSDMDGEYLDRMIKVYEGHPLALRVIAGEIRSLYEGNIQAFWDEYGDEIEEVERLRKSTEGDPSQDRERLPNMTIDLKDLVLRRIESSVSRLRKDHPLAYQLFCMGGANRRAEDMRAWLFLIGEFRGEERKLAFQTLHRRFLLEEDKINSKRYYRLHSMLRGVALEHLRAFDREGYNNTDSPPGVQTPV